MLDILIPTLVSNSHLVPECLDRLHKTTDIPFTVTVIVDGGTRQDLAGLEKYLAECPMDWKLLHNERHVGLNKSLVEGLAECRQRLSVFLGPEVRIEDPKWVLKMKQVFDRDPICGIVDTEPNTKMSLAAPVKRRLHHPPPAGCRFAMLQTPFAQKTSPFGNEDPCSYWSAQAMAGGGTSWASPGVRYHLVECKPWKEFSAKVQVPASVSPSQKTVVSPTPTTTTAGGSGASKA